MAESFKPIDPALPGTEVWAEFLNDWRRPEADISVSLYWRESDGFGQLLPRPDIRLIPAFYEMSYYTHGAEKTQMELASEKWPIVRRLLKHLAWRVDNGVELTTERWTALLGQAPRDVLEIGCGNGATLVGLANMGHRVIGVEPDPVALAATQANQVEVHPGTAEDLPEVITSREFDLVMMLHVLEHCLDPETAMRNAVGLLKPGGVLMVEVPNNFCEGRAFFGKSWLWLDVPRHLNFFTRTSLESLFAKVGLERSTAEFRGYNRQFSMGWRAQQARVAAAHRSQARDGLPSQILYLLKTFRAPEARKYDSVRVIATRPSGPSGTAHERPTS